MPRDTQIWSELRPAFAGIGQRIDAVEAQLALISEKLGLPYAPASDAVPAEVVELAKAGKTIEAMTRYRALTNASMEEARSVVMGLG